MSSRGSPPEGRASLHRIAEACVEDVSVEGLEREAPIGKTCCVPWFAKLSEAGAEALYDDEVAMAFKIAVPLPSTAARRAYSVM